MLIDSLLIYQHIRRMMMVEETILIRAGCVNKQASDFFYGTISSGEETKVFFLNNETKVSTKLVWMN